MAHPFEREPSPLRRSVLSGVKSPLAPRAGQLRTATQPAATNSALLVEALEPRFLLSADILPLADLAEFSDHDTSAHEFTLQPLIHALPSEAVDAEPVIDFDLYSQGAVSPVVPDSQPFSLSLGLSGEDVIGFAPDSRLLSNQLVAPTDEAVRTLVFVDAGVDADSSLVADLQASNSQDNVEVIRLDAGRDGITQISEALAAHRNIDALHIVSHGAAGEVQLGNAVLSTQSLANYAGRLTAWGDSLSADADILLYGCEIAADSTGQQFVSSLAALTGADVAASDDLSGAAQHDADWALEFTTGAIDLAVPFGAQALDAIAGTLALEDDLAPIAESIIELFTQLGRGVPGADAIPEADVEIPLLGQSLNDLFFGSGSDSIGDFLDFATAAQTYFDDQTAASETATLEGLLDALQSSRIDPLLSGYDVNVLELGGGTDASSNEFSFDIRIDATRTIASQSVDLTDAAAALGFTLSGAAPQADVQLRVLLDLTLGTTDADAISADSLFVSLDNFEIIASVSIDGVSFDLTLPALGSGLSVSAGSVEVTAQTGVRLDGQDANDDDGIEDFTLTLAQLQATATSDLLLFGTDLGRIDARLPVAGTFDQGYTTADFGEFSLVVLDDNALDSLAPAYMIDVELSTALQDQITSVLGELDEVADAVSGVDALNQTLPIIERSLNDMLKAPVGPDFGEFIKYADVVSDYFADEASAGRAPTLSGVIDVVNAHLQHASMDAFLGDGGRNEFQSPFSLGGGLDLGNEELRLDVQFDGGERLALSLFLDDVLGESGLDIGLNLDNKGFDEQLTLYAGLRADVSFGVDLAGYLASGSFSQSDAFVELNQFDVFGSMDASDINVGFELGFISGSVVGGSVNLAGNVEVSTLDPSNRVTLEALSAATNPFDLFATSASSQLDLSLPLEAQVGGFDFSSGGVTPVLAISDGNLFDDVAPTLVSSPDELLNFDKVTPELVLDFLLNIGEFLGLLQGTGSGASGSAWLFDQPIPFTDATVGDAFDFAESFAAQLGDPLSAPVGDSAAISIPATPPFRTTLTGDIVDTDLQLDGQIAADLTFSIQLNDEAPVEVSIAAADTADNATLEDLVRDINDALMAAELGLIVASLDPAGGDRIRLAARAGIETLRMRIGVSSSDAATAALLGFADGDVEDEPHPLADGRLDADAHFAVSIDGGAVVDVVLEAAATSDNASVADLIDDLNEALSAAGLGDRLFADLDEFGNRLLLSSIDGSGISALSLQVPGPNNPNDAAADPARSVLGFIDGSQIEVQTGPGFRGPDELAALLTDALGVVVTALYDDASQELSYEVSFSDSYLQQFAFAPALDLGPLGGIEAGGTLGLHGDYDISFTFGIDLDGTDGAEFFIEDAGIAGGVALEASALEVSANFGFAGISTTQGSAVLSTALNLDLINPAGGARLTFGEMFGVFTDTASGNEPADLVDFSYSGDALLTLDAIELDTPLLGAGAIVNPQVTVTVPDVLTPDQFAVATNLPSLDDLRNMSFSDVVAALGSAVDLLSGVQGLEFLDAPIPLVDRSVHDLFDFLEEFSAAVDEVQNNPSSGLASLESALELALGVDPAALSLELVNSSPGDASSGIDALLINLDYELLFTESVALNIDLETLGELAGVSGALNGVSSFLDANGAGDLTFEAAAILGIGIGIDLADPTSPTPFVSDSTGARIDMRLVADSLNFDISVGPLSATIDGGVAVIDADGNPVTDDWVSIGLGLQDLAGGDGRITLDELDANPLTDFIVTPIFTGPDATVSGSAGAVLPLSVGPFDVGDFMIDADLGAFFAGDAGAVEIIVPGGFGDAFAIPSLLEIVQDPTILLDGIDGAFLGVQAALDAAFDDLILPLVGDALKDSAGFIDDLRIEVNEFFEPLREVLEQVDDPLVWLQEQFFNAFESVLNDQSGDGAITVQDVRLTARDVDGNILPEVSGGLDVGSADAIQFDLILGQTITVDLGTALDLGLPALGLSLDASDPVSFDLSWEIVLGFGVSNTDGFYLATEDMDELEIGLDVFLPETVTGRLSFLELVASNELYPGPALSGGFFVDIDDPDHDGRLTFGELASLPSDFSLLAPRFDAAAALDLDLRLGVFVEPAVFPELVASLTVDWVFSPGDPDLSGSAPVIAFTDVALDLGSLVSSFIQPLVADVADLIDPLRPVLEVLDTEIGFLSDLLGERITLVSLPQALINFLGGATAPYLTVNIQGVTEYIEQFTFIPRLITSIVGVVDEIADNPDDPIMLELGAFNFGGDARTPGAKGTPEVTVNAPDPTAGLTGGTANLMATLGESAFQFPIISDPLQIFNLLLGNDADLFVYDSPRLDLELAFNFPFKIPPDFLGIDLPNIIDVTFAGALDIEAHLGVGYDTSGFNRFLATGDPAHILDGFFISDRYFADGTGEDVNELSIDGFFSISGGANLALVRLNAAGRLNFDGFVDLADPNNDGRLRPFEIGRIIAAGDGASGLLDVFNIGINLSGNVSASVDAWNPFVNWKHKSAWGVEYFWYPAGRWEHIWHAGTSGTIFSFTNVSPVPQEQLGKLLEDGTLVLNVGADAVDRGVQTDVVDESYIVTHIGGSAGNESLRLSFGGIEQDYDGVSRVVADAGEGRDSIEFVGLLSDAEIDGGDGADRLIADAATTGVLTLRGGRGNDVIVGGGGSDFIGGGDGNDTLRGNGGNDDIRGALGADRLDGGAGIDTLRGGDGDDELLGGDGDDLLFGELGNDVLLGGTGRDELEGGDGNDSLSGDGDDDILRGGAGIDTLRGGDGDDELSGNAGADRLFGDAGADLLDGGDGEDTLDGGLGNDLLFGRLGNDVLRGGEGNDQLFGEAGNDELRGGAGDDELHGATGHDALFGDSGADWLDGGEDDDSLEGGDGNDRLYGRLGNDVLRGGNDDDELYGEQGNDALYGDAGADILEGGTGDDHLEGGEDGDTYIFAGELLGSDNVVENFGTDGRDLLNFADFAGPVVLDLSLTTTQIVNPTHLTLTLSDSLGIEDVRDSAFDDDIIGSDLGNEIIGTEGDDELFGGAGDDVIYGLGGNDIIFGGEGNDRIEAGEGNDEVYGGEGEDILVGGAGNDVLIGEDGADTYVFAGGDLGNDTVVESRESEGRDTLDFRHFTGGVLLDLASTDLQEIDAQHLILTLSDGRAIENVIGSANADVIYGNKLDNDLRGLAGDDELYGSFGDDLLDGGAGNDLLEGGNGRGYGLGHDLVYFADATTGVRVELEDFADGTALDGQGGSDTLRHIDGAIGTQFADELIGDRRDNELRGGDGDDAIFGNGGADALYGDGGSDTIDGGRGNDLIEGGGGADVITGDKGDDLVVWRQGDGSDAVDFGEGWHDRMLVETFGDDDVIALSSSGSDAVDIVIDGPAAASIALHRGDRIELQTGAGSDLVVVGNLSDTDADRIEIDFGDGDDRLDAAGAVTDVHAAGGSGEDVFVGGAGIDWFDGGADLDIVDYQDAPDGVVADLSWGAHRDGRGGRDYYRDIEVLVGSQYDDLLKGSDGADVIFGIGGDDFISGGRGDDLLIGGEGADRIDGESGDDTIFGMTGNDHLSGGEGDDRLFGDEDDDVLQGGVGDDYLDGGSENDKLFGDYGADNLRGSAGDDALYGGQGSDLLDGGAGDDRLDGGPAGHAFGNGGGGDLVYFDAATSGVRVELEHYGRGTALDGQGGTDELRGINGAIGTRFADELIGDQLGNEMRGGGGDDVIDGRGGNDMLYGDGGSDTITGGDGDDLLVGGVDADVVFGDGGDDRALWRQGDGDDAVDLGHGWRDHMVVETADADDTITLSSPAASAVDIVIGGPAAASIALTRADRIELITGAGSDWLIVGNLGDTDVDRVDVYFGDGNDRLDAADSVTDVSADGGAGNDTFVGGAGTDAFAGGSGADVVDYSSAPDGVAANLSWGALRDGRGAFDQYRDIEHLVGSERDDRLYGSDDANIIVGLGGDDEISGGRGNDLLIGGAGADQINGGFDDDLLVAGGTSQDGSLTSLRFILGQWDSDGDYEERVAALSGIEATDDGAADSLRGGKGRDWFIADDPIEVLDAADDELTGAAPLPAMPVSETLVVGNSAAMMAESLTTGRSLLRDDASVAQVQVFDDDYDALIALEEFVLLQRAGATADNGDDPLSVVDEAGGADSGDGSGMIDWTGSSVHSHISDLLAPRRD